MKGKDPLHELLHPSGQALNQHKSTVQLSKKKLEIGPELEAKNQINRVVKLTKENRKLNDSLRPGSQFTLDMTGGRCRTNKRRHLSSSPKPIQQASKTNFLLDNDKH